MAKLPATVEQAADMSPKHDDDEISTTNSNADASHVLTVNIGVKSTENIQGHCLSQQALPEASTSEPFQPDPATIPTWKGKTKSLYFQSKWYKLFPWLHYSVVRRSVLCIVCMNAGAPACTGAQDPAFVTTGFRNWNKAREKFSSHEQSKRHTWAIEFGSIPTPIKASFMSAISEQTSRAKRMLLKIISSLRFLARQGLAIRGHESTEGNFTQLLNLRAQDCDELTRWLKRAKPYTSPDIQNELLQLMAHAVLRNISTEVNKSGIFSVMVDGTQDFNHCEQESICIRYVDDNLKAHEMFLGLYTTNSTTGDSLSKIIIDVLLRLNLPITSLRGQAYDGASNMSGVYNGTQALIRNTCPRALFVHCGSHCVNLVAQQSCTASPIVRDTLSLVNELGVLLHQSGKTKATLLEKIAVNNPGTSIEALRPLCPTRWTVRVAAMRTLLKQLKTVLETLEDVSQNAGADMATRANGLLDKLSSGMNVLAIHIALVVFAPLEELCKSLQAGSQTVSGMRRAVRTVVDFLKSRRTEDAFAEVFSDAKVVIENLDLTEIVLPRVRRPPKRIDSGSAQHVALTAEAHYRAEYFKVVDCAIQQLSNRFEQPGIETIARMENCLLGQDADFSVFAECAEIDVDRLKIQLGMLGLDHQFAFVDHMAAHIVKLSPECRRMYSQVEQVIRLIFVVPASSAEAERSFSALRRLKTWLRATMSQARLNHVCILNVHSDIVDQLDLNDIVDQFVSKNSNRADIFGH